MKIRIISFSARGAYLAERLARKLSGADTAESFVKSREVTPGASRMVSTSLSEWTEDAFQKADALIFVGACGIAVRSIAPYVRDKRTDPAVVVIDETAAYAIPLLSGHIGGANDLARRVADLTGAEACVTTATDRNGYFAVDEFAAKRGYAMLPFAMAKTVAAEITAGKLVGFYSLFPTDGILPEGLRDFESGAAVMERQLSACGVCISFCTAGAPFSKTLYLVPRCICVGVGARRGVEKARVVSLIRKVLTAKQIPEEAVSEIDSIDLKKEEAGILESARALEVPYRTFSADELMALPGTFSSSAFVKKTTGVDNVCERAALCAAGRGGRLLAIKTAENGVTVALALRMVRVSF